MTLCVAWRDPIQSGGKLCLAADSSVTINGTVMAYGGIKVVTIPVRYRWAGSHDIWERYYGMAFAGDIASALSLKEMLTDLLGHIHGVSPPGTFGFEDILRVVKGAVKVFWSERKRILGQNEDVDFFLAGYCPQMGRYRIARFCVDFLSERTECTEIFAHDREDCEAIGVPDAVARFRSLFDLSRSAPPCRVHFAAIRRLRDVIEEKVSKFVAGAIQYGDFRGENFFTYATSMLVQDGYSLQLKSYTAGTDASAVENIAGSNGPFVFRPTILPFQEDIVAFETRHFWDDNGNGTPCDETVSLVPHSRKWSDVFSSESGFLRHLFPVGTMFDHIGSSAVDGMPSTGVVDILVGVRATPTERPAPFNLRGLHYGYIGAVDNDPRRVVFRKRTEIRIDLLVTEYRGTYWNSAIDLRNYLARNQAEAKKFARAKGKILNQHANTLVAYNERKRPLFSRMMACQQLPE